MLNRSKLTQEILGLFGITAVIAIFFYGFLSMTADSLVQSYCMQKDIVLTESQQWAIDFWIPNLSFVMAFILFVILTLFLVGQKLAYIKQIIAGIEALRTHRMDYQIPIEGNNELAELAERINFLAKTERELQIKENLLREEREGFIRAMSHDIRTPLTTIMSYSEYFQSRETIAQEEMVSYVNLMKQKAEQMKELTDRLLSGGRTIEKIEDGRFLMEQLALEWEMYLEDEFSCEIDLESCQVFSAEFDIQELRRVFDNLASNVKKYADPKEKVYLKIAIKDNILNIEQQNAVCEAVGVESNKIGLESIRKIVAQYDGTVEVEQSSKCFRITLQIKKIWNRK